MTISFQASADGTYGSILIAGVERLRVDNSGNVTQVNNLTITGKVVQAAQSMVRLNTVNGYGSTNTRYRRFTNVVTNQGTDITYADSATLGASFTINTAGVYSISFSDNYTSADTTELSLNDSAPTAGAVTAELLAADSSGIANVSQCVSWIGYLAAGSVIRARSQNGVAIGTAVASQFTIARIG